MSSERTPLQHAAWVAQTESVLLQFAKAHRDVSMCEANCHLLTGWVVDNKLAPTLASYEKAFEAIKRSLSGQPSATFTAAVPEVKSDDQLSVPEWRERYPQFPPMRNRTDIKNLSAKAIQDFMFERDPKGFRTAKALLFSKLFAAASQVKGEGR